MVVLLVCVLVLLGCWWAWLRAAPSHGAARPSRPVRPVRPARRSDPAAPRTAYGRAARHPGAGAPPLDEDDVIAFGLALESTEDVVRRVAADRGRPPPPPRVAPDAGGLP